MIPDLENKFRKELDGFQADFRREFERAIKHNGRSDCWRDVRDEVILDYPVIAVCYEAHNREHAMPLEEQSQEAQLGRLAAGAMAGIRRDNGEVIPKRKNEYVPKLMLEEKILKPKKKKVLDNIFDLDYLPIGNEIIFRYNGWEVVVRKKEDND